MKSWLSKLCVVGGFCFVLGVACSAREQLNLLAARQVPVSSPAERSNPGLTGSQGEQPAAEGEVDLSGLSKYELWAHYNALRGDPYSLDTIERHLESSDEQLPCNRDNLVVYKGTEIRMAPVSVHPAFAERLARFENALVELAILHYGRPPTRIRHLGGFSCRKSRFRSRRISEHALGNAIDIQGFDFAPLPKGFPKESSQELPKALRGYFSVRVRSHWEPKAGESALRHSRFLKELTQRVVDSSIFRIALGPSHRGHSDHFHFDMSPWTYVHL